MTITSQDADLLKSISREFGRNVRSNCASDAVEQFAGNLSAAEKIGIMASKLSSLFNEAYSTSPDRRARSHAAYCTSVLAGLERTFGEEFLVDALPPQARSQHIVNVCKEAGANKLADLCQKAIDRQP